MRVELLGFGVAVLTMAACGGVAESGLFFDGGAHVDSATVEGTDGATKGTPTPDASGNDSPTTMTMPDATMVTPVPDTGTTTLPDATVPIPDATLPVDTGPAGPTIECIQGPCSGSTPVCCITGSMEGTTGSCVAASSDCVGQGSVPVACESASDCPGQICCATTASFTGQTYPTSITCQSTCSAMNESPLCDVGDTTACMMPGQSCMSFDGTPYGTCRY